MMKTKSFKVFAVSTNLNNFGLRGHILIARDVEAWAVGITDQFALKKGAEINVRYGADGVLEWARLGAEIPQRLSDAPKEVLDEAFPTEKRS